MSNGTTTLPAATAPKRRQRGLVLITSLLFLLMLTIIGITALSTTTLEEKMAGNTRDLNIAFQAAEAALRDAENWLAQQSSEPTAVSTCASPPCDVWQSNVLPDLSTQTDSWWQANAREYRTSGTREITEAGADPRHVIEFLKTVSDTLRRGHEYAPEPGNSYYRVTARGTGGTSTAQAVVQSTFVKRYH